MAVFNDFEVVVTTFRGADLYDLEVSKNGELLATITNYNIVKNELLPTEGRVTINSTHPDYKPEGAEVRPLTRPEQAEVAQSILDNLKNFKSVTAYFNSLRAGGKKSIKKTNRKKSKKYKSKRFRK